MERHSARIRLIRPDTRYVRSRVPMELTSFVGRHLELRAVFELVMRDEPCLLTITGPAGVGKSRLALRVMDQISSAFSGAVRHVDMAQRAASFGPIDPSESLVLLLDNCAPGSSAPRELIVSILAQSRRVRIISTSRAPLDLPGEHQWRLKPLALPGSDATLPDIATAEAVQLFIERVTPQQPEFAVTDANARQVARLCVELDGLPRALESAAARVGVLGLSIVRDAERPQRDLGVSLNWELSSLAADDLDLLQRLSIFGDGFTLEAAEFVCARPDRPPVELMDGLERLVNGSYLQFDGRRGPGRYRLLNSLRQVLLERFDSTERQAQTGRLIEWLHQMAARVNFWATLPGELDVLSEELGTLRAVFADVRNTEDRLRALRLYVACAALWTFQFPLEGAEWLPRLWDKSITGSDRLLHARASWLSGVFAFVAGDMSHALVDLEPAVAILEANRDWFGASCAGYFLGEAYLQAGNATAAAAHLEKVWHVVRSHKHVSAPSVLARLALALLECGDLGLGRKYAFQALEDAQLSTFPWSLTQAWNAVGTFAHRDGDLSTATHAFEQSIVYARLCPAPYLWVGPSLKLAEVCIDMNDRHRAVRVLLDVLDQTAGSNDLPPGFAQRLILLSARVLESTRPEFAARLEYLLDRAEQRAGQLQDLCVEAHSGLQRLVSDRSPAEARRTLTIRETEIAKLISRGLTNGQIARELKLSEGTIRTHVGHVLEKLGVHSRVQVASALASAR